ncbi:tRNA(Ile)-lysidine synthetase [Acetobacter tropicalis]|nr:tRNA(Ile)-lysidine synthetase [Acetobacter tropicalis]
MPPLSPFSDTPVLPAQFQAIITRLGPWMPDDSSFPPIALAVSGGGDSLCLAWLASRWRKRLIAFVVDHGLRPESAEEARLTVSRLAKLGVPGRILTLTDLAKGPRMAERARQARYAALAHACREMGCLDLLLGHQADDQAETVAMRQRAGSGPTGLAGMGWSTVLPDMRLVRPLLGFSRAALRNTLRQAGVVWVDDPSNEDTKAERVRVRQALLIGDRRDTLWQEAIRYGRARMQQEAEYTQYLAQHAAFLPEGWVCLGSILPEPALLSPLIRSVGGLPYPPSPSAVARLCAEAQPATLAGVQMLRHKGQWILLREAAAMQGRVIAQNGNLWDNRFVLHLPSELEAEGLRVGAAGIGVPRASRAGWPARLCATLPALWREGQRVAVPHLNIWEDPALCGARFTFRPPVPVSGSGVYGELPE